VLFPKLVKYMEETGIQSFSHVQFSHPEQFEHFFITRLNSHSQQGWLYMRVPPTMDWERAFFKLKDETLCYSQNVLPDGFLDKTKTKFIDMDNIISVRTEVVPWKIF